MITLCMDTSHTWLALGLMKDDQVIAKVQEQCWKKQSEEIFPKLIEMLESVNLTSDDIDQIVISEGPGSYTGVRIAMTIAKVFCAMGDKPLYTLPTLQLYAGLKECRVIVDARGKRAYTALFKDGKFVEEQSVMPLEEIGACDVCVGDASLVGKEDNWPDIIENFASLKNEWKKAENVHMVVPEYLKSSDSYMPVKKS